MRREDNFQKLVSEKKIIIPIIQRDYAQGRDENNAKVVRTRLIDEWIDVLENDNLRMDFNYIYGTEINNIFLPVDGQQRLTSLYLLNWYLAHATSNADEIKNWQFSYNTRNSATEFFEFLRNVEESKKLFDILDTEKNEPDKQKDIKNETWYKMKWENDPTIISCINFLCELSDKFREHKKSFNDFRVRLNNDEKPAVYFTCLSETNDEYAEIEAAKKYTRMNARGKRLTNFENIKAMIDEIEMKHIEELEYCIPEDPDKSEEQFTDTISWSYDCKYIDSFFQSIVAENLAKKTEYINNESEKWFKLIYYVYLLKFNPKKVQNVSNDSSESEEKYEETIYKISQDKIKDSTIKNYLYMLKAIFEVLCNDKDKLTYRYYEFSMNDLYKKRKAIAFVIFMSEMWNVSNSQQENYDLILEWKEFEKMLEDLRFDYWMNVNDCDIAEIIKDMVEGIKNTDKKTVKQYFIVNDFDNNSPFLNRNVLPDIKCRIIEQKIKSKLIYDDIVEVNDLNKTAIGARRYGYLFYICGYLEQWKADDWSQKPSWNKEELKNYIDFITYKGNVRNIIDILEERLMYAYASQYDMKNRRLHSSEEINKCNNEHIWNFSYFEWNDDEYDNLPAEKVCGLRHFKVMLDLLIEYKKVKGIANDALVKEYINDLSEKFNFTGYEDCWLRFAIKYPKGGQELLNSKLEATDGIVKIEGVPVILKVYLQNNGYSYYTNVNKLKKSNRMCTYFVGDAKKVLYSDVEDICEFTPDPDDTGKYKHSTNIGWNWNLSGNVNHKNMDMLYKAYLNLSAIGCSIKKSFFTIDVVNGAFKMRVYETGSYQNGTVKVVVKETFLDNKTVKEMEDNINRWTKLFQEIKESPNKDNNYDRWIEIWNNEYKTAFGPSFDLGNILYDKSGGIRPKKIWSEILDMPQLTWQESSVYI